MLLPCGVSSAESGSLPVETQAADLGAANAMRATGSASRRIVLSRLASWALAYNNAPVAMVKTVLGRNAMRCGALSRPADAPVAHMLQRWYPSGVFEASQSVPITDSAGAADRRTVPRLPLLFSEQSVETDSVSHHLKA